jgi:hypothetical protein
VYALEICMHLYLLQESMLTFFRPCVLATVQTVQDVERSAPSKLLPPVFQLRIRVGHISYIRTYVCILYDKLCILYYKLCTHYDKLCKL